MAANVASAVPAAIQLCTLRKVSTMSASLGVCAGSPRGGRKSIGLTLPNIPDLSSTRALSALLMPPARMRRPRSRSNGARISEYQPPPGDISTTVILSRMPKNASVSSGCRKRSRARLAGSRCDPSTAAFRPEAASVCCAKAPGASAVNRASKRRKAQHISSIGQCAHMRSISRRMNCSHFKT